MICHSRKCIFVHVPRTAGESIERVFLGRPLNVDDDPYLGSPEKHLTIAEIREQEPEPFHSYFKFSIVRNPWDRFISTVLYRRRRWQIEDPLPQQIKRDLSLPYFHEKTASRMLCIDGELAVDHIIHFDRLDDGLKTVWTTLGMPQIDLAKSNSSPGRRPYWQYFNHYSEQFIRTTQHEDIERFGFHFEGDIAPGSMQERLWTQVRIRAFCLLRRQSKNRHLRKRSRARGSTTG